jgi:hypothetical protein
MSQRKASGANGSQVMLWAGRDIALLDRRGETASPQCSARDLIRLGAWPFLRCRGKDQNERDQKTQERPMTPNHGAHDPIA